MAHIAKQESVRTMNCDEVRCRCGQLVARWAERGIEIKCKRCRRLVTIAFTAIEGLPPAMLAR